VDLPHHFAEIIGGFVVTQGVIVVIQEGRDPRREDGLSDVVLESIPEYLFGAIRRERWKRVPAPRRDEVDLVVPVPMFETVLTLIVFLGRRVRLASP
jgi:hypothetical protein